MSSTTARATQGNTVSKSKMKQISKKERREKGGRTRKEQEKKGGKERKIKKIKVKGVPAMGTEFRALCPKCEGTRPLTHAQSFHEEPCYVADYQLLA